ncbi:MAG: hypothetical protein ABEH65_05095 [Halobacteriales archaeon]
MSAYLREQPFLWIAVDDAPDPDSERGFLERNTIGLLSNLGTDVIDPRPADWLGHHSRSPAIRDGGLWNIEHAGAEYDPTFLERLWEAIAETTPP